ncbi:MAG: phage minor head protein [Pseudomonadota bacterium]
MARIVFPGPIPQAAIDLLAAKKLTPGFDHRDVWKQEHLAQFTVAKAMCVDVLRTVRESLQQALARGQTFESWKKNLQPELARLGWWGKTEAVDPLTGEVREVNVGSRRLKRIYQTNMRTARAHQAWQRYERTAKALPFLEYNLGPSEVHRPHHVAWAGTILPVDHPFWDTHAPQNGWGCKCWLRQLTKRAAEALGGPTEAPAIEYREWVNERTGEVERVPVGIDPGWDYNPGKVPSPARAGDVLTGKLNAAPAALANAALRDFVASPAFATWYDAPAGALPVATLDVEHMQRIGALTATVRFSAETAEKQKRIHPELTSAEYIYAQEAAERGEAIQEGDQSLIYILEQAGYAVVIKATLSGKAVFLTSLRRLPTRDDALRRELERLRKKGVRIREQQG